MISAAWSGVTCRGLSAKTKPSAWAPASTASSASSRFVMPQILTLISLPEARQLSYLRRHVTLAHQGFADQHRVRAAGGHAGDVRGRPDATFTYQQSLAVST